MPPSSNREPTEPSSGAPVDRFYLRVADILERVADGLLVLDHDWHILYANRQACRMHHKPLEQFVGRTLWEEWPENVGTEVERQFRRALAAQGEAHFEHRYAAETGSLWMEIDVYPVEDGLNVFYRDVTARKSAEEELRRSEQRYHSLIDATAEIVWTNTPEGQMNSSNAAWSAYTGQTEEEYQGYGWARAVHPDDAQPTVDAWREAVAARRPFLFEHRLRRHDGVYRTFAIRAVAVREPDGAIREWVGIHTDVTERRQMERTRESLLVQQAALLRDVLSSVTGGKLVLANSPAQLPAPLTPLGDALPLTREGGLRDLRLRAQEAAQSAGHPEGRQHDLLTAASEAGMNAIVHGGGGTGRVAVGADGTVQVWVEDHGTGIALEHLPRATLARGFSTKATLGHGLKMMLETADRLYLMTGPTGTTLVLELTPKKSLPSWLTDAAG